MRRIFGLGLAMTLAACSGEDSSPQGELDLVTTDRSLSGSYIATTGDEVLFESTEVEPGVIEISVATRGMTMMATMDTSGVMDLDVYASESGEDTQLLEADRAVINEFSSAIFDHDPDTTWEPLARLERLSSLWGSWPETNVPTVLVLAEANRSYTSLCGYVGWWMQVTHDGPGSWIGGCGKDNWEDSTTWYGLISAEGSHCSGADHTGFSTDGSWGWCGEPDHSSSYEYGRGYCFAQCGEGCGSPDYTIDCADHDSCVRFGHATVSISCQDEFDSTLDDWGFSPVC